jgi:tRNA1Val (adenine37-N6)-methyltransferase
MSENGGLMSEAGPEPLAKVGEDVEQLGLSKLKIIQPENGYRFSIDPVLLCHFARIESGSRVADLGTGNGVIPLMLAQRDEVATVVGLERQSAMVDRAQRSVALNNLQDRVTVVQGDVRQLPASMPPQSFDVVVTNPPFRAANAGRIAPDDERAAARHELAGNYSDFLRAAAALLGTGGWFFLIFLAERLVDLLAEMRKVRLEPKRLRLVHSRQGKSAKMVLVEGRKDGRPGLYVEPPLMIYKGGGRDYTDEVLSIYQASWLQQENSVEIS